MCHHPSPKFSGSKATFEISSWVPLEPLTKGAVKPTCHKE